MDLFDISLPLDGSAPAWPTNRAALRHDVWQEGPPRDSDWTLYSHAGTHLDAPLHWLPGETDAAGLDAAACLGPCTVVEVTHDGDVAASDLPAEILRSGHRVLLKTSNSHRRIGAREFDPGFAAIAPDAAAELAEAGVALVGLDYLSVERPDGNGDVHRTLLGAGVVLLEAIDLRGIEPGEYTLSALPLALPGGEASPVRAVLWR